MKLGVSPKRSEARMRRKSMDKKIIEFNKTQKRSDMPKFQAGDVVSVSLRIKEGEKERTQTFEGLIIAVKGGQSSTQTITVRKVSHGVGVELILPVGSKNIEKIELIKKAKVRRAKLYYIRNLTTKQSRMKYKDIKSFIKDEEAKSNEGVNKEKAAEVSMEEVPETKVEEKIENKTEEKSPEIKAEEKVEEKK